jgi:hypothetical protein
MLKWIVLYILLQLLHPFSGPKKLIFSYFHSRTYLHHVELLFFYNNHLIYKPTSYRKDPQRGSYYTTTTAEKITTSSVVGCMGGGGMYTRAEGSHEASVEEGTTEPKNKTTPRRLQIS